MTRVRLATLVLSGLAATAACVLNPQPIPPEDLETNADDAGSKKDSFAVFAKGDAASLTDPTDGASNFADADPTAEAGDSATDAPSDAPADGG